MRRRSVRGNYQERFLGRAVVEVPVSSIFPSDALRHIPVRLLRREPAQHSLDPSPARRMLLPHPGPVPACILFVLVHALRQVAVGI